ncbi:response regulator, partial [Priestia sp. SIMBA_032]
MRAEPAPIVVLVEDDPTVRDVVVDYLGSAGFEVRPYADGRTALVAVRSSLPDVLVVDRMLPGLSGDELCRAARSIAPALP